MLALGGWAGEAGAELRLLGIAREPGGQIVLHWEGETGAVYALSAAHAPGHEELFYPLRTNLSSQAQPASVTNAADPSPRKFYRIEASNRVGAVLILSDTHFSPFASTNIVTQLVAAAWTEWRGILAPLTNGAFFAKSEWGENVTDFKLFDSALGNARAVLPEPDLILFPGDYPVHDVREHYTAYTGDASDAGYRSFVYKLFGFVGGEIARRWPATPVLTVLGNNDSYLGDYQLEPEGAFLADAAGLMFTNGMSNLCAFADYADDFGRGGYYSVGIGTSAQAIGLATHFMSVLYTNPSGFSSYDPATNALRFLDAALDACAAAGRPAWLLLHILPGVDAYATYHDWKGQGDLTNAATFWHDAYLREFMAIVAEHSNVVRQIFCGHTHMDEFRLVSDPVGSNVVAAVNVTPGIDWGHGNNPAFQVLTYDRGSFDVRGLATYALSRPKYAGRTGAAGWDLVYSYNSDLGITGFAAPQMEQLHAVLTNSTEACETYRVIYETGSGAGSIPTNKWPVYSTAIRWLTETQFLERFAP